MTSGGLDPLGPIHIRPEVTVLSVLRHLNYKAWFALAEFIDNSLQSAIANLEELKSLDGPDYQLVVDVRLDASLPGLITITDNAAGIATADFRRAFRPAHVPLNRSGLSEFGMGMKSAACWFAENWSVRTKALGEVVERTISFDVRQIVEQKIESLDTESREVEPTSHYTVVSLRNLHHLPQKRTVGKIKDHLASIYRVFIRDKRLKLRFNGEELIFESPPILRADKYRLPGIVGPEDVNRPIEWQKSIDLDFGEGQRVTGFVALREVGSTPLAGFSLFRRNRLIVGSFDETYRPPQIFKQTNSYPYQRVFGELHVEGFEVSHTKDGFRWEEYEDEFLDCLREEVAREPLNLLAQADNYRALPSRKAIELVATQATEAVAHYVQSEIAPRLVETRSDPPSPEKIPQSLPQNSLQASERVVQIDDGGYCWKVTLRTTVDPATENWLSLGRLDSCPSQSRDTRDLEIELSLVHPFSSKFIGPNFENAELLLRMAAAISIALILSEDLTGSDPDSTLHYLNLLLRGALLKELA